MAIDKENKIKAAIDRRQADLEENQRRMIGNVMDHEIKKIHIDRVLCINDEQEEILITDEDEIKKKVVDHFQNCAETISINKEIPDFWEDEYPTDFGYI